MHLDLRSVLVKTTATYGLPRRAPVTSFVVFGDTPCF